VTKKPQEYASEVAVHDPSACFKQAYAEQDALEAKDGRAPYMWAEERREELRLIQEKTAKWVVQRWMDDQHGKTPGAWDVTTQQIQPSARTFFATVRCATSAELFDSLSADWLNDANKGVDWDDRTWVSVTAAARSLDISVGCVPGEPHHRYEVRRSKPR